MTGPLVWDFDWERVAKDVGRGKDLVVADVGGGLGGVLAMVLEALPQAKVSIATVEKVKTCVCLPTAASGHTRASCSTSRQ